MTKFVAIYFHFNHPTMLVNLGKYAYFVESNSKTNAKKKFIAENAKDLKPRNGRYPVEIYTIPEYIREWERAHSSYITEGYQLVSYNSGKSWGISTKNAKHDNSDIKHAALDDVGSGDSFIHSVPRR